MDRVQDESHRLIVRSIIELVHNPDLQLVTKSVETRQCWDMLYEMCCDTEKGYYMSDQLGQISWVRSAGANQLGLSR